MKALLATNTRWKKRNSSGERGHSKNIKISFNDLKYTVKMPAKRGMPEHKREVLRGCTGFIAPGHVTYIMGSSGAGKTSLLNAISDRIGVRPGDSLTG
jgi:ABC-type multidrug transport system ATPase subunit